MDYKSLSIEELIRECAKGPASAAWVEFDRRFKRLIGGVVIATCRKWSKNPLEFVGDLVNETYIKLLRNNCSLLVRFKPQHENAFLGYLKFVAASVSHNFFRKNPNAEVELDEAVDHAQHGYGDTEATEKM